MNVVWIDGVARVTKVSRANKLAYRHVEGDHEVLVAGHCEFVGSYAECAEFRDQTCHADDMDAVTIQPWFDTSEWAREELVAA